MEGAQQLSDVCARMKRSRECIDTVVHARINARRFLFNLLASSYVMHVMTHQWEEECCDGNDNLSEEPELIWCERVADYWLYHDLLPEPDAELVFSNKYDIGTLQSKPLRCPRALPTDGTCLAQAAKKKGKF